MEDSPKLLEIGMYVYLYRSYGFMVRLEIQRVTEKQAFSGTEKFVRQITERPKDFNGTQRELVVKRIGEYGVAYIETPDLINRWKAHKDILQARRLHEEFKIREIDGETAEKIIHFYESLKPELIDNNTSS